MDRRSFMQKSLNFAATQVVDEYSSSGSYGASDTDSDDDEEPLAPIGKTNSQVFTVDLAPMFATHSMKSTLPESEPVLLSVSDTEFSLEGLNCPETAPDTMRIEPTEGVVANVAHLEQFPKAPAGHPSIYAWFNAETAFSGEYSKTIENYFKNWYSCIRASMTFMVLIAPAQKKFENLVSVRNTVPAGRVLYHYIGHGFPTITAKNIWCSERRSTEWVAVDLESVFVKLQPPTWFVFDCSNAGAVIPTFEGVAAMRKRSGSDGVDWDDWFCICATSEDEQLPSDPGLPRDFLTSCILSPVKMAIVCRLLQQYRSSMVGKDFPLESPCKHLWCERSVDASRLSLVLTAITDAIAAESLSPELYRRLFRMDRLSSVVFRNFLLAQFLLRPYRVHPVSHPALPDLSTHRLWKQWTVIVDSAVCSVTPQRPSYAMDLFRKAVTSFETLIKNGQLELVRPDHLRFLFHMISNDPNDNKALLLLTEYASHPKRSPSMLTSATVFHPLFAKMIAMDEKTEVFHSICYFILTLLYHHPDFADEIRKELNVSRFPRLVMQRTLPVSTKVLVSAILANLLVSNDMLHQVCTSSEYLLSLRRELANSEAVRALWLMLIIRGIFHMCSPDPAMYVGTALHLQCALYVTHTSPACRAAAVGALACLLRPFECNINGQLMFMALPTAIDASYLVRFHLLLLLKKFIISFDASSDVIKTTSAQFPADSLSAMMAAFYRCDHFDKDHMFTHVDDVVHLPTFISHAYQVAIFLVRLYRSDPHPSIASMAGKLISFAEHQTSGNEVINDDDDAMFANLEQNESLCRIALRNVIETQPWRLKPNDLPTNDKEAAKGTTSLPPAHHTGVTAHFTIKEISRVKIDSIVKMAFHKDSLGIAIAAPSSVLYIDDKHQQSSIQCAGAVDLHIVEWEQGMHVVIATAGGFIYVWQPGHLSMKMVFRVSLSAPVVAVSPKEPHVIITADNTNSIYKWDLQQELLIDEWETGAQSQTTSMALHPDRDDLCIAGYHNGVIRELDISKSHQCSVTDLLAQQPHCPVKNIAVSSTHIYSVCENGRCDFWKDQLTTIQQLSRQQSVQLHSFGLHPLYPILLFSPVNGAPFVTDLEGKIMHVFKGVESGCACAVHPILPIVALGTPSGELITYHLSQEN